MFEGLLVAVFIRCHPSDDPLPRIDLKAPVLDRAAFDGLDAACLRDCLQADDGRIGDVQHFVEEDVGLRSPRVHIFLREVCVFDEPFEHRTLRRHSLLVAYSPQALTVRDPRGLGDLMMCPHCGSRRVNVIFEPPMVAGRAARGPRTEHLLFHGVASLKEMTSP